MQTFSALLKALRMEKGLSQDALARAAGLSVSAISKLEQNDMDPAWSTVQQLAKALGVSCEAFADCAARPPAKKAAPSKGKKTDSKKGSSK